MKNLFVFYLVILAPLAGLGWWMKESAHAEAAVACFLGYAFTYRPLTDGFRLFEKGLIKKAEIWKMFLPFGFRLKYFKELYFK